MIHLSVVIRTAIALMLLVGIASGCAASRQDEDFGPRLFNVLAGSAPGDMVDVAPALGQGWDRIVLLETGRPKDDVAAVLGFVWPDYEPGMTPDGSLAVFIKDDAVMRWAYLPEVIDATSGSHVAVWYNDNTDWVQLNPGATVVEVHDVQVDGPIQVCYPSCL